MGSSSILLSGELGPPPIFLHESVAETNDLADLPKLGETCLVARYTHRASVTRGQPRRQSRRTSRYAGVMVRRRLFPLGTTCLASVLRWRQHFHPLTDTRYLVATLPCHALADTKLLGFSVARLALHPLHLSSLPLPDIFHLCLYLNLKFGSSLWARYVAFTIVL